jgi:hypothetical protein
MSAPKAIPNIKALFMSSSMYKTPMYFDVLACPVSPEIGLSYVYVIAVSKPHF